MSSQDKNAGPSFEALVDEMSPSDLEGSITIVGLQEIAPCAHSARLLRNPKWDELKASIEASGGLTQPLSVTRRPGEATYTLHQGGNTRLAILQELHAETGDERYAEVEVDIRPFTSELELAVFHARENLCRGPLTFFEQAWAKYRQFELFSEDCEGKPTARAFIAHLRDHFGDGTTVEDFSRMRCAVEVLYQHIPTCLVQGAMSQRAIRNLITVRNGLETCWRQRGLGSKADFEMVFFELLSRQDKDLAETFLSPSDDQVAGRDERITLDWSQFAADFCHECTIVSDDEDFFDARAWVAPVMQLIDASGSSDSDTLAPFSPSPRPRRRRSRGTPSISRDQLHAKAFELARQIAVSGGLGDVVQKAPSSRFGYRLTDIPEDALETPCSAACRSVLAMNLEDRDVDGDAAVSKTIGMTSITALQPTILSTWSALLKTHARLITMEEVPARS